jgi:CBS domain-containing protein
MDMGMVKGRRKVSTKSATEGVANAVRRLTCSQVMAVAHFVSEEASVHEVLEKLTQNNWDHLFIVSDEGVPIGRIHAVDVLKLISRKAVNRNLAWMMMVPAIQMVRTPPLQVGLNTPLLKAGALMLTHDLNQLAVVNGDGELVGTVSHATMARNLPRFLL